jgi:hypothetical protein
MSAFAAKNENVAKRVFESLESQGLPVTTWPDLAPEVYANRDFHKSAWTLRHSRFYLPQHQGHKSKDILTAAFGLSAGNVIKEIGQLELKLNETTREQWNCMMCQVGRSNLMQSWSYGEAKSKIEGWKVRRIVIWQFNKPVAFAQILGKNLHFSDWFELTEDLYFLKIRIPNCKKI